MKFSRLFLMVFTALTATTSAATISVTGVDDNGSGGVYNIDGVNYLAVANEGADGVSAGTALWQLTPVPEPGTWAMLLAGLAVVAGVARRRA